MFSLTTTDPINHPLPHPELLTIHAAVVRIARAAGAANVSTSDDWPLDDNGSNRPVVQGVPDDLGYALREYLNNVNETEFDPCEPT